jgi:MFS_1 like family
MADDPCSTSGGKQDCLMASGMGPEFEGGAGAPDPAGSMTPAPVIRQPFSSGNRSDGFSWRLAAFYAAVFGSSGLIMPFFPAWLQAKGLDARATGIVLAVPMFIRLVSVPSLARLADRRSVFRGPLIASAFGSALAYVVLSQAVGFVPILLAVALAALATAPTMPLLRRLRAQGARAAWPRLWSGTAVGLGRICVCQFRRRARDRPDRTHSHHLALVRVAGDRRCGSLAYVAADRARRWFDRQRPYGSWRAPTTGGLGPPQPNKRPAGQVLVPRVPGFSLCDGPFPGVSSHSREFPFNYRRLQCACLPTVTIDSDFLHGT